jgi:hypothetical protein
MNCLLWKARGCPKKSLHGFTNPISLRQSHLKMSLAVSSSLCGNYQKLPQACPSNAIQTKKPFWVELDWIGSWETSTIPLKSKDAWKIQEQVGKKLIWAKCLPQHNLGNNCKIGCLCNFSYWRPISVSFYLFTCMIQQCTTIPQLYHKMWARTGLISVRSSHNLNPLPKSQIPADDWLPNLIQLTKGMYQQSSTFKIQIKWIWSKSSALGNSQLGTIM